MDKLLGMLTKLKYKLKYRNKLVIGKHFSCRKRVNFSCQEKGTIRLGNCVFINSDCSINALVGITIGDDTILGENVKIYDHNHKFNKSNIPISQQGFSLGAITIGNNCWIGSNCVILKGVSIGDNCVIGAGCIISKDVPDDCIARNNQDVLIEEIINKG